MSVCGIVFDKVQVRVDGKTAQKVARIIIGFAPDTSVPTKDITFCSKFIHYPEADVVHNDIAFLYNGIDAKTISNQGEKQSHVVDWFRASVRNRTVIVCGSYELMEMIGDTHCNIIDLQNFFYSMKSETIKEPISLVRLANRFFGYDPAASGARNPFQECQYRIGLYYVMKGFQACGISPPFAESSFPKIAKLIPNNAKPQQQQQTHDDTDGTAASRIQAAFSKLSSSKSPIAPLSLAFDQHEYFGEEEEGEAAADHIYENDTPVPSPPPLPPAFGGLSSGLSSVSLRDDTLQAAGRGMSLNLLGSNEKGSNVHSNHHHANHDKQPDGREEIRDCDECRNGPTINLNISLCKTKTKFSANILRGILSCMTESI
jgi:hypothetical protein